MFKKSIILLSFSYPTSNTSDDPFANTPISSEIVNLHKPKPCWITPSQTLQSKTPQKCEYDFKETSNVVHAFYLIFKKKNPCKAMNE